MDTSIIIMTAIVIAIFLIPIVIFTNRKRGKKAQVSKILNEMAGKHNASISTYDTLRNMAFGMTDNNAHFVYYKKDENNVEQKFFISLSDVKSCELIKTNNGSGSGGIGKLSLRFVSRDKTQSDVSVGFYDRNEHFQIANELGLTEKWKQKIDFTLASAKDLATPHKQKVTT